MEKQPVVIYTEASPNPNSLKFVLNFRLLDGVSRDYPSKEDAKNCPLAIALFEEFPFVKNIFVAANFITVTKDDAIDWYEVNPQVRAYIKQYIEEGKEVFNENIKKEVVGEDLRSQMNESEIDAKIKSLLDTYVKPAVEGDGGAISFHSFEDGVVKVILQGSCSGCPSSTVTLKNGIENLLKRMVPEVTEVVSVNG